MSKTDGSPVSLANMLGTGEDFSAKDKIYTIKSIALKRIDEFMKDNLSLGSQLFNISNPDAKTKVDKWLAGYCFDAKGEAVTLEKAMADDWDIVDLKGFFKKLCDLSG